MNKKFILWLLFVIGGLVCFGIPNGVLGIEFPIKPIELVCPWGSFGSRIIAPTLSEFLGTPVIPIGKTGAGGTIGAAFVARAKPDGYTLLVFNGSSNGIAPAIRSVSYKNSDFEVFGQYAAHVLVMVAKSDAPWKTVDEMVAYAKKNPGKLKYGTTGIGTVSHFAMELFKITAGGLKIDHIPFKSGPEYMTALLGGHIDVGILYGVDVKGPLKGGKIRAFAMATEERMEDFPDIPTFTEIGYPEVKVTAWHGIAGPIGIPKEISDKLKAALYKTFQHPDAKKRLKDAGYVPVFRDAEEFARFAKEEEKKYLRIAKEADIKID